MGFFLILYQNVPESGHDIMDNILSPFSNAASLLVAGPKIDFSPSDHRNVASLFCSSGSLFLFPLFSFFFFFF